MNRRSAPDGVAQRLAREIGENRQENTVRGSLLDWALLRRENSRRSVRAGGAA